MIAPKVNRFLLHDANRQGPQVFTCARYDSGYTYLVNLSGFHASRNNKLLSHSAECSIITVYKYSTEPWTEPFDTVGRVVVPVYSILWLEIRTLLEIDLKLQLINLLPDCR